MADSTIPAPALSDTGAPQPDAAAAAPTPSTTPDLQAHIDALIQHESSGNPQAIGDKGEAFGLGQFHHELRERYNITSNSTPEQQKAAVTDYFTSLWNKHNGNADDALSEYHLGAPKYAKGRTSASNQTYLKDHYRFLGQTPPGTTPDASSASEPAPAAPPDTSMPPPPADLAEAAPEVQPDVKVRLPDNTVINLGPNPTPELRAQVKAKILAKFPTLGAAPTTAPVPTPAPRMGGLKPRISDEETWREASATNRGLGLDADHPLGHYAAKAKQAIHNATVDFVEGARGVLGEGPGVRNVMQLAAPLTVAPNIVGSTVEQVLGRSTTPENTPWYRDLPAAVATAANLGTAALTTPKLPEAKIAEEAAGGGGGGGGGGDAGALNPPRPLPEGTPGPPAPPVTPGEAGATIQARTRTGADAIKADIQEGPGGYDEISNAAKGFSFKPGEEAENAIANIKNLREQFGAELDPKTGKWTGGIITGQQRDAINSIEDALKSGTPIPYPQMEDFKRVLDSILPFKKMVGATPKESALYAFKSDFRDLMRSVLAKEDPALAAKFDTANARWATEYQPASKLATKFNNAETPEAAFAGAFGAGTTVQSGGRAKRVFEQIAADATSPAEAAAAKDTIQRGFVGWLVDKATKGGELDTDALLAHYDKLDPGFRDTVMRAGDKDFFEALRANKPGMLARFTAKGLEIGAGMIAGRAIGHPFIGMAIASRLPVQALARFLGPGRSANLISRAMRTPASSAAANLLMQEMLKEGIVQPPEEKK